MKAPHFSSLISVPLVTLFIHYSQTILICKMTKVPPFLDAFYKACLLATFVILSFFMKNLTNQKAKSRNCLIVLFFIILFHYTSP